MNPNGMNVILIEKIVFLSGGFLVNNYLATIYLYILEKPFRGYSAYNT